jgi:DNA replication and repair protein RecF
MYIEKLTIQGFRVFESVTLKPAAGMNVIWGDNGVGKTSVLEALFVASRGRSFRHREAGPFIRKGNVRCRVVVHLVDDQGARHVLGVERAARDQVVRLDGSNLTKRSEQVRALPLQVMTPNSHALLEGAPELRRRYLDLGLFHVEQPYHQWYSDYQRTLRQRNAAIRRQPAIARSWDEQLARYAAQIDRARQKHVDELSNQARDILSRLSPSLKVSLAYRPGWDPDGDLAAQLAGRWQTDQKMGFTGIGPHRADILITAEQSDAAKRLSRGQQKLVVTSLMLAQAKIQQQLTGVSPVILFDDLPAELDRGHRDRVAAELAGMGMQTLITSVEADLLSVKSGWGVFHVEHGGHLAG